MPFSSRLKELLEQRGLTARELSTATDIPESTLSEWLKGRAPRFNESILNLSRFFGVPMEALLQAPLSATQDPASDLTEALLLLEAHSERNGQAHRVLGILLKKIAQTAGASLAHIYLPRDAESQFLSSSGVWYVQPGIDASDFQRCTEELSFEGGIGVIGKLMENPSFGARRMHTSNPEFLRREAARDSGLSSGIAFPLTHPSHSRCIGVIELFFREAWEPDPEFTVQTERLSDLLGKLLSRSAQSTPLPPDRVESLHRLHNRVLKEVAGGVAHEINNPLAVIRGHANSLRELDPSRVQVIDRAVDRISKVIGALAVFSGNEDSGERKVFPAHELIQQLVPLVRERFRSTDTALRVSQVAEAARIRARPSQLIQALHALILNAYEAAQKSQEKWVELHASVQGQTLRIELSDSGPGIPKTLQRRIFTPLFSTKDQSFGTGLGIPIARGIIEAHGGSLWLESPQSPTLFVVSLPLVTSEARPGTT